MINRAVPPLVEPGLGEVLSKMVAAGRLRATPSTEEAVKTTDLALSCVGTPGRASGQLDDSALDGVQIGRALRARTRPFTVVLRSTVVPGATERVLLPAVASGTPG